MALAFDKHEIDHHILKLIVGLVALTLAHLTTSLADAPLESISESYHAGGWAHDIFVGFLFAIAAFLLAYNGESTLEALLSKAAALAALGVAMFPCRCGEREEILPYVHYICAAVMFLVLAVFCLIFAFRAQAKRHRRASVRAALYAVCCVVIVVAVAVLAYDGLTGGALSAKVPRLVFYGERAGLIAFGISWLVASRVLPGITAVGERIRILPLRQSPSFS